MVRRAVPPASAFLAFCFVNLFFARPAAVADDWLPVDPADLAMKSNPAAPGAHAEILYTETVYNEELSWKSYYTRIKIFDEEGKKFASIEFPAPREYETVEDLRARTIHPDGSAASFTGRSVRTRKASIDGGVLVESFQFADAPPGSIIEYRYRLQFHFDRARMSRSPIYSPAQAVEILSRSQNYYWHARTELFQRQTRFVLQLHSPTFLGDYMASGSKPEFRTENLPEGTRTTFEKGLLTCEADNVPALGELPFPPPSRDLQAHIEIYYPGHKPDIQSRFWGEFAGIQRSQEEAFRDPRKLVRRVMEETLLRGDSSEEKLRKLYARAQAIRNEDYEPPPQEGEKGSRVQSKQSAEEVLRVGSGSSRDINAVLVALALEAGLDAGTAYVSRRDVQNFDAARLDWSQLSAGLAWVQWENSNIALDPGTPFCPYGLLPWPKTSAAGLLLRKKGSQSFSSRALSFRESGIERDTKLQLMSEGRLRGSMQMGFFGETSLELRLLAIGKNEEERAQVLASRIREWLPEGAVLGPVHAAGWDTTEDPLRANVDISLPAAVSADGKVSLPLFLSGAGMKNPFENSSRRENVQFPYPFREIDQLAIALPAGGGVEQLPARKGRSLEVDGIRVVAPEGDEQEQLRKRVPGKVTLATYQISAEDHGTFLLVKRELASQILGFTPENYPKLRDFFSAMKQADSQNVVLRTRGAAAAKP